MVTHWQKRKAVGDAHEQRVAAALAAQGWTVERCGQGTYQPAIQQALAQTTSALRWFPDLIAARAGEVVTIDAKDCMPSSTSGRYAVSDEAIHAGLQFIAANRPTPLYYVFGDLRVLTPVEVLHYTGHAERRHDGAYRLVSTRQAHPFDTVFGCARPLRAAS
ncbi:hypothetical protein [Streptomyces lateritius]|uniref:hypothetical protein n=1 Tax=Streptomyces lateritius TaxID=67313 RepID=UPI001C8BDD6A|nr:hypothetical protein [Streptomyces lateritius]MBX9427657.1 hypothetical protein [Streptomyces lateritius]